MAPAIVDRPARARKLRAMRATEALGTNLAYVVDRRLVIIACNSAYARSVPDADFLRLWGAGCSLMSVIPAELREHYARLFEQAFAGTVVEHRYQCHDPTHHREFLMRLLPDRSLATVLVEHALVVERALPGGVPLTDDVIRQRYAVDGLVVQCSHCRKVRRNDDLRTWDWVPQLIARPWPMTSHGLCTPCLEYHYGSELDASTLRR